MNRAIAFVLAAVLLAPGFTLAQGTGYVSASINRDLKLGDFGEDVLLLQKTLNLNAWTRVSSVGPGSPGNETRFFGARTREAVARFQERYASEVLAPAGLTRGTGFVGTLTRRKIAALLATTATATSPVSLSVPAPVPNPASSPVNPNLVNLEPFLEKVAEVQEEHNVEEPVIAKITSHIRTEAETKGDFRQEFIRKNIEASKKRQQADSAWRDILIASFKKIDPFVKVAHAQGPAFGGSINYIFPCTCSETALIYVLGATTSMYLDYVYGTQGFLYYNLPYATYVKGLYTPGAGESCNVYVGTSCSVVTSAGMIDSTVGSA